MIYMLQIDIQIDHIDLFQYFLIALTLFNITPTTHYKMLHYVHNTGYKSA